jgi:hypothetical protein
VERCDLAIDPVPVDLVTERHELVPQVDDLIEPGAKQIAFPSSPASLVASFPSAATTESRRLIRGNLEDEFASFRRSTLESLRSQNRSGAKNRLSLNDLFTDDLYELDFIPQLRWDS